MTTTFQPQEPVAVRQVHRAHHLLAGELLTRRASSQGRFLFGINAPKALDQPDVKGRPPAARADRLPLMKLRRKRGHRSQITSGCSAVAAPEPVGMLIVGVHGVVVTALITTSDELDGAEDGRCRWHHVVFVHRGRWRRTASGLLKARDRWSRTGEVCVGETGGVVELALDVDEDTAASARYGLPFP